MDVIESLNEEIVRLRGFGSSGTAPALDLEAPDHGVGAAFGEQEEDDDAGVALQLEQMAAQAVNAQAAARQGERDALLEELLRRDEATQKEREALQGFMEELLLRDDEAGDAVRADEFATEVDARAEQQRSVAASSSEPDIAQIIQKVRDPATFEALLEVQRLDEAIETFAKRPATPKAAAAATADKDHKDHKAASAKAAARGSALGRAASRPGSQSRSKLEKAPPGPGAAAAVQSAPQSQQRNRQPLLASSSVASSVSATPRQENRTFLTADDDGLVAPATSEPADAVSALAVEVQKLKGIDASGPAASDSQAASSAKLTSTSDEGGPIPASGLVVGGRRSVGGVWMSLVDVERIERLLSAGISELEKAAEDALLVCPDGEGYRPVAEQAQRLREIEQKLIDLSAEAGPDEDLFWQLQAVPPTSASFVDAPPSSQLASRSSATNPSGPGKAGGHSEHYDDYLSDNRQERADKATLERVRDRLAALHQVPTDAPPTGAAEQQQLADLLACVRRVAEQRLETDSSPTGVSTPNLD